MENIKENSIGAEMTPIVGSECGDGGEVFVESGGSSEGFVGGRDDNEDIVKSRSEDITEDGSSNGDIAKGEKGEVLENSLDNGREGVDGKGSLEAEILRLKEEGERQRSEFEAEIRELKIQSAALERLYGEGAKNPRLMLKLIDFSKADFGENGSVVGLDEQIDSLKSSEGYLFGGHKTAVGCFRPEESGDFSETHKTDISQMTYSQMLRALGE